MQKIRTPTKVKKRVLRHLEKKKRAHLMNKTMMNQAVLAVQMAPRLREMKTSNLLQMMFRQQKLLESRIFLKLSLKSWTTQIMTLKGLKMASMVHMKRQNCLLLILIRKNIETNSRTRSQFAWLKIIEIELRILVQRHQPLIEIIKGTDSLPKVRNRGKFLRKRTLTIIVNQQRLISMNIDRPTRVTVGKTVEDILLVTNLLVTKTNMCPGPDKKAITRDRDK